MVISTKTYEQVALEDPDGKWELACGVLRQKPEMTIEHNDVISILARQLDQQLDEREYMVRANSGRVRVSLQSAYIPDLFVISQTERRRVRGERAGQLEFHDAPLPLVVEVWSRSTGDYDVEAKIPEYQRRGDAEIWRIHPYEQTLTAWRRQSDGSYSEAVYRDGAIAPVALPGVTIDIPALFE
ncbi:MAG: Uma2 family endonuclease [Dehalococcoidia bacterium]